MSKLKEVTFFVTNKCNLKCERCFNVGREIREMQIENINTLTESLPKFTRLQISGGEPFLREDLDSVCASFYYHNNVRYITIPTNGLLEKNIVSTVLRILLNCYYAKLHISVSINEVKLYPIIFRLKLLKQRYPNLTIGTITTQTSQNEHDLFKIYDYIKTLGVDNIGFNMARITDRPNPEIYRQFTNMLAKTLPNFPFPINYIYKAKRNLVFKYVYKHLTDPKWCMPCFAGDKRIVIDTDGTIYPCEMRLFEKEKTFVPIKNCFCQHECDMGVNILYNPRFIPELVREVFR